MNKNLSNKYLLNTQKMFPLKYVYNIVLLYYGH